MEDACITQFTVTYNQQQLRMAFPQSELHGQAAAAGDGGAEPCSAVLEQARLHACPAHILALAHIFLRCVNAREAPRRARTWPATWLCFL